MSRSFLVFLLFFLSTFPFLIHASEEHVKKEFSILSGMYQFSFDNIVLPQSEKLGLLGGNYLVSAGSWYTGLGVYGAITGDRGGFFTGGVHFGKSHPLKMGYYLDGNVFFGGGGGGSAPQGGGLMLRAALGLGKQVSVHRFFLGLSRIAFPNGEINSDQLSFAYARDFTALHFSGWHSAVKRSYWESRLNKNNASPRQVSLQILNYFPRQGVVGRNLKAHESVLSVLGIRVSQKISSSLWGEFETGGAMSGGIDGFAQVLGGLSFKKTLSDKLAFSTGWLIGAAGGGNVDTGGGVISRIYSGVEVAFSPRWSSLFQVGYISSIERDFSATTLNMNLVYNFRTFDKVNHLARSLNRTKSAFDMTIKWRKLRVRPGLQKYTFFKGQSRKGGHVENIDIDLTNLKLDAFLNSSIFITGQALGAFKGKAGGYAAGLIGSGVQLNKYLGAEFLVGVAGGGGVAVGSGKIIQPMLNFELPYNKAWSTEASIGYIKAVDDDLTSFVFNVGMVYHFSQAYY